jgi:cellulose synthase/poly-beta-1,6-N-acetylglucosamine synthase-like glycosyltransferase
MPKSVNNKFSLNYRNTSDMEEYLTYLLGRSLWSDTPTPDLAAILPAPLETYSFRTGIQPRQLALINIGVAAIGSLGILQPVLTALALSCVFLTLFSALILFRLVLVLTGLGLRLLPSPPHVPSALAEDLPTYSILVAAYEEAGMMRQLADALDAVSWPNDKLEVFLLLEADDPETLQAAQTAGFSDSTRLIIVPPGGPKTKPNALNHGLALARGTYVTVYDVEDLPHPDQLLQSYALFENAPDHTVCVQAPLVAVNGGSNWIAAQWALEYDVQFGLLLPSLSLHDMPILLGGTSNHFCRETLLAAGGWDAWNVTEDADLGIRLARAGLKIETIPAPTFESAPTEFGVWYAQRSRWLKGYLQTWLVLMRDPATTLRQMGLVRFLVTQLTLGGAILAPLVHAPCAALVALAVWSGHLEIGRVGLGLLFAGLGVGLLGDLFAPGKWSWTRLLAIATRPLYWPLHSLAAYRALWELANKPFFWAKTPHHPHDAEPRTFYSIGS